MPDLEFGDIGFEFELPEFSDSTGYGDIDVQATTDGLDAGRYMLPKHRPTKACAYRNAMEFAQGIELYEGVRQFAIVPGSFIFGEVLEALVETGRITAEEVVIHTLSLNEENVDSLANVREMMGGFKRFDLVASAYFYGNYRGDLVPYIYQELDTEPFRCAFSTIHTKLMAVKTKAGHKLVFHGSANLRSSGNIEQVCFDQDDGLYDFIVDFTDNIMREYDCINHDQKRTRPVRGERLWQAAARASEAAAEAL